jgi:UrcA family protein
MSLSKFQAVIAIATLAFAHTGLASDAVPNANESLQISRIEVSYADLNLESSYGAERLVTRIARAAKSVCGSRPLVGPGSYALMLRQQACVKQAENAAILQVNRTNVAAAYAGRQGKSTQQVAIR